MQSKHKLKPMEVIRSFFFIEKKRKEKERRGYEFFGKQ